MRPGTLLHRSESHRSWPTDTLDSDLIARLRDVVARGQTTESDLRELSEQAAGFVRSLRAQLRASERRLRTLSSDSSSPITEIAGELRRVEQLRPQLSEARELLSGLETRARELRTDWLLRQADATRPPGN